MKEIRVIQKDKVRTMCIADNYYTRGTNSDYDYLLNTLCQKKFSLDTVSEIAKDIIYHSDIEKFCGIYGCTIEDLIVNVTGKILNKCCYSYIELKTEV